VQELHIWLQLNGGSPENIDSTLASIAGRLLWCDLTDARQK